MVNMMLNAKNVVENGKSWKKLIRNITGRKFVPNSKRICTYIMSD